MSLAGTAVVGALKCYRRFISPLLPRACRFSPSCSCYAIESVRKYGALRGGAHALWRLAKCHPFHPGGYDPVR